MKPRALGVRTQILVALFALLALAFVPLYFAVASLTRASVGAAASDALLRLVALYTGVFAIALLVFAYLAITRLVVQPLERLARAARLVEGQARARADEARAEAEHEHDAVERAADELARTGRELAVQRAGGGRELRALGESLAAMASRLREDRREIRAQMLEARRSAEGLVRAQESLVRSERLASVGRLAAGLAHEIGNPLAAILGFQELLLGGGLDDVEVRDFLARMKRETERIHRVLGDLLEFARPESAVPHAPRAPEASSVAAVIDDAASLMRPQRGFKDVALEIDAPAGLPAVALGHARLEQVLVNLLLNAGDAVEGSGAPKRVRVRVRATCVVGEPARVRVDVDDSGPGVDPAVARTLFEPFVTTKAVGRGTGLGLAVCRGIVEAVGGTLAAGRGDLGGACFSLELPVVREATDAKSG